MYKHQGGWRVGSTGKLELIYIYTAAAAAAKSLQSCLTLCNPIDDSPPSSPVPGILQARTLKWVAVSFSNAWMWKMKVKSLGCVWLLVTPWTAAYEPPPSMEFSRQEYWSRVPLPSPNRNIYINNYFKCKGTKCSNQKTGWMDAKRRSIHMLSTRNPLET